jgi:hypothetical protein
MSDLVRSVPEIIRRSKLGSYMWMPEALANAAREVLPAPWFQVEFLKPQTMGVEPPVCFKHPARCEVVCQVMDGKPISVAAARYMRMAYGPHWWHLAY